jgi:hypothetical protein
VHQPAPASTLRHSQAAGSKRGRISGSAAQSHDRERRDDFQFGPCDWVARDGTLMGMQPAAAVLLVTLLGPSILSAVCDVTCVRHEHHRTKAAAERSCHEERPSDHRPALTDGTASFCHEQATTVTSTSADVRILNAAPVAIQVPSARAVPRAEVSLLPARTSLSPPGIVIQTTPLRI